MNLEISGEIIAITEKKTGTTPKGEWTSQDVVIEHESGEYAKKLAINNFNDKITGLAVGDKIKATCNIDAQEYQGKYYNKVSFWKCEVTEKAQPTQDVASKQVEPEKDDLPF